LFSSGRAVLDIEPCVANGLLAITHGIVNMNDSSTIVLFRLDDHRYALRLAAVTHVIRAVEITSLPDAPALVDGVIDVRGEIVAVFNIRRRLRLQERALHVDDQFILARTGARTVALVVDEVLGICTRRQSSLMNSGASRPGPAFIAGVISLDEGLALIQDLERFLSPAEEQALEQAMMHSEHAY
jgi:purine-binding chemotaxis protein CheW